MKTQHLKTKFLIINSLLLKNVYFKFLLLFVFLNNLLIIKIIMLVLE